jgi:hypothetical protein
VGREFDTATGDRHHRIGRLDALRHAIQTGRRHAQRARLLAAADQAAGAGNGGKAKRLLAAAEAAGRDWIEAGTLTRALQVGDAALMESVRQRASLSMPDPSGFP